MNKLDWFNAIVATGCLVLLVGLIAMRLVEALF